MGILYKSKYYLFYNMYYNSIYIWFARFLLRFDLSTSIYCNPLDNGQNCCNHWLGYTRPYIFAMSCGHSRPSHWKAQIFLHLRQHTIPAPAVHNRLQDKIGVNVKGLYITRIVLSHRCITKFISIITLPIPTCLPRISSATLRIMPYHISASCRLIDIA